MTKAQQDEARAELARMRETRNQTREGVALFAAFASVSLPMALDALEAAEAELERMRDREKVQEMGVLAFRAGEGWSAAFAANDPEDDLGEQEEEFNRRQAIHPTKHAALDSAVAALREAGLMGGEHG